MKATAKYLKAAKGSKSMAPGKVSQVERIASRGIDASNSISESLHASSTHGLKLGSTIRLDHCAAEGQTRANNDFGRGHVALVSGRKSHHEHDSISIGTYHMLPPELQRTAIIAAKENAGENRQKFDVALKDQFEKRRRKEEIALEKKYENASEDYIVAIYLFEQYDSPRCWLTAEVSERVYSDLNSETRRLAAVKEQILIRYLGLGWEEAYHAWSGGGTTFTSKKLLKHLVDVVIPLVDSLTVPHEPPVNLPTMPELQSLGTISELALDQERLSDEKLIQFKQKANDEIDKREDTGLGDRWYESQMNLAPKVCHLKGFNIEMLFAYNGDDGTQCLGWYQGVIKRVVNEKTIRVRIKWDEEYLGRKDARESDQKLVLDNWNPKIAKKGRWQENLANK